MDSVVLTVERVNSQTSLHGRSVPLVTARYP